MDHFLEAKERELVGKKTKRLRQQGQTPIVLYGREQKNLNLTVLTKELDRVIQEAGTSSLVSLKLGSGKAVKTLIKDIQLSPVKMTTVHADFYQVNMKEKIRTTIPLEFIGQAPVVTDQEGKIVTVVDEIEVECLPDDLIQHIEVNLGGLVDFDQSIYVKDLTVPPTIEILTEPDVVILSTQAPISEAELEADLAEVPSEAEALAEVQTEEKESAPESEESEQESS